MPSCVKHSRQSQVWWDLLQTSKFVRGGSNWLVPAQAHFVQSRHSCQE